jgi:hypothetical protein
MATQVSDLKVSKRPRKIRVPMVERQVDTLHLVVNYKKKKKRKMDKAHLGGRMMKIRG